MTSHRTGSSRPTRRKAVRPPRFGPAWYKKRRVATKRRVAAMSRRRRVWRRVGILGTWLLAGLAVVLVVAVVAFYQLSDVVTPDKIKTDQVATILYSDGSVMARVGAENRTDVRIDQVPEQVKWAVLAAEDRKYYSNPGVSITGTLRAAWNDVTGGETQGGSGITQQYVKNAYLNADQTLSRKLKELAIAVKLDRNYSKDTILEYYLNTIYFGRGAYGVQAAAQTYFGVDVGKLDVAQGAVLASLIRSPGYYDPAVNPDAAKDRFRYVLDGMVETGHLTRAEADATAYPTVVAPGAGGNGIGIPAGTPGLIVNRVLDELDADGIPRAVVNTRGITVQTTIEPKAQNAAAQAVDDIYGAGNGKLAGFQSNIKKAIVAVQPSTGAVLAYWGGENTAADQNDYAGVTCQSPGSSFKPYTLAVGLTNALTGAKPGYSLNSVVDGSSPQTIGGTSISNDPSDKPYESSRITVARAMEVSLNTVFDAMAEAVQPAKVAAMAHAAGVATTCQGQPTLVDANGQTQFGIGIGDYPVRTIDQASGFATFAAGGIARPAYTVSKVTANDGTVLYQHQDQGKQVMDPKVANDVTVSLGPIATFSRNPLDDSRPSASKTGTYGIESCPAGSAPTCKVNENSRAWTVGYTPSISVASWAGSQNTTDPIYASTDPDDPSDGQPTQEYGRDLPGRAWKDFMNLYLDGTPIEKLPTQAQVTGGQNVTPTAAPSAPRTTEAPPTTEAPTTSAPPTTAPATPTTPVTPTTPPSTPTTPAPTLSIPLPTGGRGASGGPPGG